LNYLIPWRAKIAFEKYFLYKVRAGTTESYYEKAVMNLLDIGKSSGGLKGGR
jgi:hypothetical protein